MVDRRPKILKIRWLKHPKTVPKKRNLDQQVNDEKLHMRRSSTNIRFSGRK